MSAPGDDDVPEPTRVDTAGESLADDGDFPKSKTVLERLPLKPEPQVAVESWSNDLPPADIAAPASPAQEKEVAAEPPSEPTQHDPARDVDDGWGHHDLTGSETASHSMALTPDAFATGTLGGATARAALGETRAESQDLPRLVCIEGPDLGKEFVLTGRDVSIGRGAENDVVVNDSAMSRLHCRILVSRDQVIVTDQRSANGTIVNGRKIDRATIASGATIKLGGSLFRFVEMGDVIKSSEIQLDGRTPAVGERLDGAGPSQAKQHQRMAFVIVGGAALVALLIVASSVWSSLAQRQPAQKPEEIAETAFAAGVSALQAKQVDEAVRKFRQAQEAKPDKRYRDHLALAEKERANLAALAAAFEAADKNQLGALQADVARVSADTIYISDVTNLRLRLMQLRDQREHDADVLLAKRKWAKADDDAAVGLIADLRAVEPDAQRVRQLSDHPPSGQKTFKSEPRPVIEKLDARENRPAAGNDHEAKALKQFSAGDMDAALSTLSAASLPESATALKNKILKFQEVYAQAKAQAKQPGGSASVKKALAFELKIANGTSRYAIELKQLQADADVDAATSALSEQRFAEAYHLLKDALTLAPGYAAAARKLSELSGHARDTFNQGYILKDSDLKQARDKWKAVMAMVPPEDEAYQKAKKWLDQTK
jgi:hypothetical protein